MHFVSLQHKQAQKGDISPCEAVVLKSNSFRVLQSLIAMPAYKLYYFNRRARAEPARILFNLADVKYEDVRYEREEWLKHREGLCSLQLLLCLHEIILEMPFGQMPVLEVDSKKLGQCSAIYQYLAKQFGTFTFSRKILQQCIRHEL
jgi:hypothetical protein